MNAVRAPRPETGIVQQIEAALDDLTHAMELARWHGVLIPDMPLHTRLFVRDDGLLFLQLDVDDAVAFFPGGHLRARQLPFAALAFPKTSLRDALLALADY